MALAPTTTAPATESSRQAARPRGPLLKLKPLTRQTLLYLVLAVIIVVQFLPLIWALLTSLMTPQETTAVPVPLWPAHPTVSSYSEALQGDIGRYYLNSIIASLVSTLVTMFLATLAAYAFARLRFRWKRLILLFVVSLSLFPPFSQVIPLYMVLQSLHLIGSLLALIIPYSVFGLPMAILILMAFLQEVPFEYEEAAALDGLSRLGAFVRIVLPMIIPGLFTTAVIVFVGDWNEYLFALNYTTTATYTLPVGIVILSQTEFTTNFGVLSAAMVMSVVPLVALILLLERRIVSGLTAGGLKG
ncbi:MAG: carbohydrate ABC transporter permease [Thermogemmatispora sp.]|uniref:carbohydrate ABC transporter permease n=1 Tax=Thermogemmatispora sp. TaxID=1968838 RepID=UPI00262F441A|nr:carbohydrate ABC transporter permease [Thermogemmatispora sp.]MBX5457677.1 carbohydrate ABC transporter permease [Thermogemmatispora sp.]